MLSVGARSPSSSDAFHLSHLSLGNRLVYPSRLLFLELADVLLAPLHKIFSPYLFFYIPRPFRVCPKDLRQQLIRFLRHSRQFHTLRHRKELTNQSVLRSGIYNHQVCRVFTVALRCRAISHQVLRADCLMISQAVLQIHFVLKSDSFFCSVCNAPGNTSTLKDVTSSWARSRRSNGSIELTILQNHKAVVRFISVTPWQSAINSIQFLSDILNLPYSLANWWCCSPNVLKQ